MLVGCTLIDFAASGDMTVRLAAACHNTLTRRHNNLDRIMRFALSSRCELPSEVQ
jgi:hypothetical protein